MKKLAAGLLLLVPIAGAACSKKEAPPPPPPITEPADAFGAKDTIYASVDTAGTGHAKLRAVWTFVRGEKTAKVDETTLELDATGPATNEFHIAKPSGWPKGDYRLDVFLNDGPTPVMTKAFKVG